MTVEELQERENKLAAMTVEELQDKLERVAYDAEDEDVYFAVKRIVPHLIAVSRAEGAEGIMSCPLYTHGWANDDDRRGEVHCCDRKGHEMSWNPDEMRDGVIAAGIDPASVLAPTKEKP